MARTTHSLENPSDSLYACAAANESRKYCRLLMGRQKQEERDRKRAAAISQRLEHYVLSLHYI